MVQTGIDPSQLTGVATSASAGGYQTVRGEAQVKGLDDYDQHNIDEHCPKYLCLQFHFLKILIFKHVT